MKIVFPKYVFEDQLASFLGLLSSGVISEEVVLDFKNIQHYIPAAITSIIASILRWESEGKRVVLVNHKENKAFRYLQRIDFFTRLGLEYSEDFNRHAPLGDFVTITEVSAHSTKNVESLIEELVGTLCPEKDYEDLFRLLQYALGEVIRNCIQHSMGQGFVAAQYTKTSDLIRIGIADNGIGVRESFKTNDSPHFREHFDDQDCLKLALKPEVSSKNHIRGPYGDPVNAGVGLSIVQAVSAETFGNFFLGSGTSAYLKKGQNQGAFSRPFRHGYGGTVVSIAFSRKQVDRYAEILMDAKRAIGLISEENLPQPELFT